MPLTTNLLANWGVAFTRQRQDIAIPGSPERCVARRVVEDDAGRLWLLEQLGPGQHVRREAMGLLLESLQGRGLGCLAPHRRSGAGNFVVSDWGRRWQLSPFFQGVPLPQPGYLENAGMGRALGAWLCGLRRASSGLRLPDGLFELHLPAYVRELIRRIGSQGERQGHCPPARGLAPTKPAGRGRPLPGGQSAASAAQDLACVHARALALLPTLEELFEAWGSLPTALCHGDIHPLNVVWSSREVLAVIDWEFAGVRPALYDLANCLGCLAMEGGSLATPFAAALLEAARRGGLLPDGQAPLLAPMILATRFGWLSEWLRRGDADMLASELAFMEFLSENPAL